MESIANGSWRVKKLIGQVVNIVEADSSIVAVLPAGKINEEMQIKEAYLIAAAPELFDACCKINSVLENNLIVTREGFKINFVEIQKTLSSALMRALGCRKDPEEP
jgi:hypothetical protein